MTTEDHPSRHPISGRKTYEDALDQLLEIAQRSVQIFDASLSLAYNSPRRVESLRRFLQTSRISRLQIVVHNAKTLDRTCPRLINLLRQFPHAVAINATQEQAKGVYDPFAICDTLNCVRRFHFDDLRGELIYGDTLEAGALAERFAELWSASDPGIAPTTLGL